MNLSKKNKYNCTGTTMFLFSELKSLIMSFYNRIKPFLALNQPSCNLIWQSYKILKIGMQLKRNKRKKE
jgi:hypothetical protein